MDTIRLETFLRLQARKDELEDLLDDTKRLIREVEQQILKEFETSGVSNVRINGELVYLHRQLWARARDGDKHALCAALRANGLGLFVEESCNTNSVSAYVREQDAQGIELPAGLAEVIEVTEVFSVRSRKG